MTLHRQGRFDDAVAAYQAILEQSPAHFDALHLLGVAALQNGNPARAAEWIGKAVEIDPRNAATHSNLGLALRALGKLEPALACFERAVARNPASADAWFNQGLAQHDLGRFAEAAASCARAIALRPEFARAHGVGGVALQAAGRSEEALASFDRALALDPDDADIVDARGVARYERRRFEDALRDHDRAIHLRPGYAEAYLNRGAALQALGRFAEALGSCEAAIALKPGYAKGYNNRGNALRELGRIEAAIASFTQAIALNPDYPEAHNNRANALREVRRGPEALADYERALALRPGYAEAWSNRGNALREVDRLEDALASLERAVALEPGYAEAWSNRGNALRDLDRFEEAIASYERALALKPDYADAHWNLSLAHLQCGEFEAGWRGYEWRKRMREPQAARSYAQPLWLGEQDLHGRTILVHFEQGLGDAIQFCRYLDLVAGRGARILFAPHPPLRALMRSFVFSDPGQAPLEIVDPDDPALAFDFHCPLLSLPLAFRTDAASIPARVPYLAAEPDRVAAWAQRIGIEGFRIGVGWQGSAAKIDHGRSFPLAELLPLARRPGVRLISLQKGKGEEQLVDLPEGMRVESFPDLDAGPDAFLDTAALMKACDLVVTCDTALGHLAGALDVPAWIALKRVPDWRWRREGSTTPWHPAHRLFRQSQIGDWASLFQNIAEQIPPR